MKRTLAMSFVVLATMLAAPSAQSAPAWCQAVTTHTYWVDEWNTQRGPWALLSRSQKDYYNQVQKKADRARRDAVRAILKDTSSLAGSLSRDLALLATFDFDVPMNQRQQFVDAAGRVRSTIRSVCGVESRL